jgi:hypothetical protein
MKQFRRGSRPSGRISPTARVLALSGAVASLALAGCAAAPASSPAVTPGTASLAATTGTAPADPASVTTPAQRAQAAAAVMLKAFAAPPGAQELPSSPVPSSVLSRSQQAPRPLDNDVVTKTSWWLAPGDPRQLLAWTAAHLPAQYQRFDTGTVGPGIWSDDFNLPAVAGLFDTRSLAVSVTSAGHGQTAIRVDALVDWIPVRPAGDTVPATARAATLVETADKFGFSGAPTTVIHHSTLTDPAKVAALARYLNGLPVNPPGGAGSCPMPTGGLMVTFRAQAGGPVLAQVTAAIGGCDTLTYEMPGHPDIGLGGGPGGDNLLPELNRVTGQHWKPPQG